MIGKQIRVEQRCM